MTDPFDAAATAGHQLQTQLADAQQALAAETAKEQADAGQIAALTAQVAALQAQLTPKHTPGIAWGSCLERLRKADGSPETYTEALARVEKAIGKLGAIRFYHTGGQGPAWPSSPSPTPNQLPPLDGRVLVYSFPYDPAQVVAGAADAAFVAFAKAALASGEHVVWVYAHEMDAKIRNGVYTLAAYRAAAQHLLALAAPYASPSFQSAQIFTDYLLTGATGLTFDQLYEPGVDLLGWDSYAWGPHNPVDLAKCYSPFVAASAAKGKPWFIGETGADKTTLTPATAPSHTGALTQLGKDAQAANPRPLFVCWFNYGPRWTFTDDPAATAAVLAGQSTA